MRNDLFVDGFIEWTVGRWMSEFVNSDTTFLDIGCGDMSLSRYVPHDICYNAIDVSISEFHLRRLMNHRPDANLALASVVDIPLGASLVSFVACTQVLEYVTNIDRALSEIYRISSPDAKIACSIANGYSSKYLRKGVHRGHVNRWTYVGFVELMSSYGFRLVEGDRRGVWIPLPRNLGQTSFAFPVAAKDDRLNTVFLFLFSVDKHSEPRRNTRQPDRPAEDHKTNSDA